MAYFGDPLFSACKDFVAKNSENADLCAKIHTLAGYTRKTTETKRFLADVKQVLQTKCLPDADLLLQLLVPLYLSIGNKNAAKKVLSSYFQGLPPDEKEIAQQLLCERVQELCETTTATVGDASCQESVRHVVDMLAALMDNFAVGEACVTVVSSSALLFLARSQTYFFHLFRRGGQSAVQVNSLMHDCHITMQVLNRLTQRHLLREPQHLSQSALAGIMQMDLQIMREEQMMMDCRCCCAIHLMLLLQIAAPVTVPQMVMNTVELGGQPLAVPPWLREVGLDQLLLSSLSPMTALALLWGMLSMLDTGTITMETVTKEAGGVPEEVVATEMGDSTNRGVAATMATDGKECGLVCEALLGKLLYLDERCQTTASRVQCVKTVTLWTTRMMSCLKEAAASPGLRRRLRGDGETIQHLLNFVWTHWQDQLDVMRQNSRIIFDNCLKLHVLASQCADAGSDPFLLSVLQHVLRMDWSNHSKFSALTSLARCLGAQPILLRHPRFPATLLAQMADQGVACHASELYEVLMGQEKERGGDKEEGERGWLSVWVDPVIAQLCSSDKKLKQHIIEYILPKIMKKDKTVLEYMLNRLSSFKETGDEQLGAMIVCLRRARAWGLMSETLHMQDSSAPIWTKILSALSSPEQQVRLDAFALLCENKRTAEAISDVEFRHLRHFITYNLNNQSPAFRQAMLSFVKKLLFRINESQQALLRLKKRRQREKETTSALQSYESFLSWLEGFLFMQLYPSAAFARRTMSLAILSLLVQDVHTDKDGSGYKPLGGATVNHVHTLLECLTDTFEENKQEALKLLLACTSNNTHLLTAEKCRVLYSAGMQLAASTRPQDCGTAAYIFRLLLQQPCAEGIMLSHGPVPQLDLRCSSEEGGAAGGSPGEKGARHERQEGGQETSLEKAVREMGVEDGGTTSATLQLLQALLRLLVEQVAVAQTSLILAAANRPIYPTLHCIRYILEGVDFRCLEECHKPVWSRYVGRLLEVCLQVAAIVSPVVQNSSPEGNVPEEAVLGPGLKFDPGLMAEVEESRQMVSLMPEYLVVCCWRSIKEVSLLLGELSQRVPITQPGAVSQQQVEQMGQYFKQQLMESLHRGAFELAYAGFVMMCQMLWKSPWSELQTLPRRWLEEMMSAITSPGESVGLCATRRSAGVPFFIQAIVATETAASGRPSFHQAIGQLLDIALSSPASAQPANTDGQVHALNILRALYKDTRLGEDVAPYICQGLKAAILGFKSQFWEIRNSATLLLSALMTRIFGVKRSKDESMLSKRNSQTGRAFFHKYPELYQFLLTELEMATQDLGSSGHLHLHPSLYPVLMVLGRLFPSTMEGTTTRLNLAAFIPYVIKCCSSPVYKTRMMAARALQPLAGKEQLTIVLTTLLDTLPKQPLTADSRMPQSHIHGILLQVYHLLLLTADVSGPLLRRLGSVCASGWLSVIWLISRQNPCLCTRKVALDVTDLILSSTTPVATSLPDGDRRSLPAITHRLLDVLSSETSQPTPCYSPHTPFLSQFLGCVATLAMKYLCFHQKEGMTAEETILRLLGFEAYEVHLAVLESLMTCWAETGEWRCRGHRSAGGCDQADPHREDATTAALVEQEADGDGGGGGGGGGGDSGRGSADTVVIGAAMTTAVVDRLLLMGLQEDAHAETIVKVFHLLSLPPLSSIINQKCNSNNVFEQLLLKLQMERSADVKAALIQFSGRLFPALYSHLKTKADSGNQALQLLREWSSILAASCEVEQPDDLHLSCAHVLEDNAVQMLVDTDRCLGRLVFDFWTLLVTLLQADDLEVKDVVASISGKLCSSGMGGSHPEQALFQLIGTMFSLHADTSAVHCLTTALSWMTPQSSSVENGMERLFDKGELNTFQDSVALARVTSESLEGILNTQSRHSSQNSATGEARFPSQVRFLPQGDPSVLIHHFQAAKADDEELIHVVQTILSLAETEAGLPGPETDSLEHLFLKSSVYCDRAVLLIKFALVARSLQTLSRLLPVSGTSLKAAHQKMTSYVKFQVNRHPSRNLLLGFLVDSL